MPKNTTENDIKIKNFHCSEHGYVKPIVEPRCPESHTTTENGWEKEFEIQIYLLSQDMRRYMFVESQEQSEFASMDAASKQLQGRYELIKQFIQQIAKEAYERGRVDERSRVVKVLNEWPKPSETYDNGAWLEAFKGFLKIVTRDLEAALETPNTETL